MKTYLFFLLLFFAIQSFGQKHFVGIQGGLNTTKYSAKESLSNTKYRSGFIGGLNYEFESKQKFRFGIDALYSQDGFKSETALLDDYGNLTGGEGDIKYNYNYFSLPVKIGYAIGNDIKIIPRIGITPSLLSSAKVVVPQFNMNGEHTGNKSFDVKNDVKKFDIGGVIELGMESKLSKNILFSPIIAYKKSFTSFSGNDHFHDLDMKHYGFSITLAFKYQL